MGKMVGIQGATLTAYRQVLADNMPCFGPLGCLRMIGLLLGLAVACSQADPHRLPCVTGEDSLDGTSAPADQGNRRVEVELHAKDGSYSELDFSTGDRFEAATDSSDGELDSWGSDSLDSRRPETVVPDWSPEVDANPAICDDNSFFTRDRYVEGKCINEPILVSTDLCCSVDDDCPSLACAAMKCEVGGPDSTTGRCVAYPVPGEGCCLFDSDCPGNQPCAWFSCQVQPVWCVPWQDPGCLCPTQNSCWNSRCTQGWQCEYVALSVEEQISGNQECCFGDADCRKGGTWEEDSDGDGAPGPDDSDTLDTCVEDRCKHTPSSSCDCKVPLPDGCNDKNDCTLDSCFDACLCRHEPALDVAGCCASALDCPSPDGYYSPVCFEHHCHWGCGDQHCHPDIYSDDICIKKRCNAGVYYESPITEALLVGLDCCASLGGACPCEQ